ncbi:phosphotransferase enzyme family protein [Streptomyces sp. NPDC050121]|uniref:phosphotransferase enzyme family protein n=1 Tax=Streptomyces sp. NPDC050121 TaxID=3365601 RepID=UPI0037AAD9C3
MAKSGQEETSENCRIAAGLRIAAEALPRFGIDADVPIELLPLSENVALRARPADRPPVVVRISPPGQRAHEEVCSELAWLAALKKESDVPVVSALVSDSGESAIRVADPVTGTMASLVVFEHVTGKEPQDGELAAIMPRLGHISAQLHQHAVDWKRPAWFRRGRWDTEAAFGKQPRWGRWQAGVDDRGQRQMLERLEQVVTDRLNRFGTDRSRFGLVHADLRSSNLLVDGDVCHLIDFDDAGFGWWLYDLATALTFYEDHPQSDEMIASWVQAYREVRPLSDEDEREIPTFLMLRRLLTLAFLGNNSGIEVTREWLAEFPRRTCELAENYLGQFDKRPVA